MNNRTLYKIIAGPFLVIILHIIATLTGWYEMFWWFDIPMHFFGGLAVAFSSSFMLNDFKARGKFKANWKPLNILILIGFAAIAAIAWEIMEFSFDLYFHTHLQPDLLDTMKDLSMGLIGGGLAAIITVYIRRK